MPFLALPTALPAPGVRRFHPVCSYPLLDRGTISNPITLCRLPHDIAHHQRGKRIEPFVNARAFYPWLLSIPEEISIRHHPVWVSGARGRVIGWLLTAYALDVRWYFHAVPSASYGVVWSRGSPSSPDLHSSVPTRGDLSVNPLRAYTLPFNSLWTEYVL